jgi:hypothetical protein
MLFIFNGLRLFCDVPAKFLSSFVQEISHFAAEFPSGITPCLSAAGSSGRDGGCAGSVFHMCYLKCQSFNACADLLANPVGSSFIGKIRIGNIVCFRLPKEPEQSCAVRYFRKFLAHPIENLHIHRNDQVSVGQLASCGVRRAMIGEIDPECISYPLDLLRTVSARLFVEPCRLNRDAA